MAYQKIAQIMTDQVPSLPFAKIEEFIAWAPNIRGMIQTDRSGVAFNKASHITVLRWDPDGGPLWLRLTGRDGVKKFLEAEGVAWIKQ